MTSNSTCYFCRFALRLVRFCTSVFRGVSRAILRNIEKQLIGKRYWKLESTINLIERYELKSVTYTKNDT